MLELSLQIHHRSSGKRIGPHNYIHFFLLYECLFIVTAKSACKKQRGSQAYLAGIRSYCAILFIEYMHSRLSVKKSWNQKTQVGFCNIVLVSKWQKALVGIITDFLVTYQRRRHRRTRSSTCSLPPLIFKFCGAREAQKELNTVGRNNSKTNQLSKRYKGKS